MKANKVVLAYSGGLDTSCIVPWLKENYDCEVITYTANLGQGDEELENLEEKAEASGASKAYVVDLREEFLTEYAFPTMQAGAIYEHEYLLGTSFARPVTAKYMVEVAEQEGADAVAHGCTGKGNDQVRFELTVKALNPLLGVIAPGVNGTFARGRMHWPTHRRTMCPYPRPSRNTAATATSGT